MVDEFVALVYGSVVVFEGYVTFDVELTEVVLFWPVLLVTLLPLVLFKTV